MGRPRGEMAPAGVEDSAGGDLNRGETGGDGSGEAVVDEFLWAGGKGPAATGCSADPLSPLLASRWEMKFISITHETTKNVWYAFTYE